MTDPIAIVGIACRYPDASSPDELWENVLAGRRAFRRIPDERMRLEDYWSPDPAAPDKFYARKAAVIEGFEFDRVKYKIAGSTYRATDMTHWLALDTAARALEDAGFADGDGLPKASDRRDRRQHPHRRIHQGQRDAAALAVRPAHARVRA